MLVSKYSLNVRSGGVEIIASDVVHTFSPSNLEIELNGLELIFDFIDDGGERYVEKESLNEHILRLKIYNFNDSIGTGVTAPIEIGYLDNRRLFIAFTVYALSQESIRRVEFTYFLREEM